VDFCTFDWAVNSGPGRAAKALQKSVMVVQDGAIGPRTLAAVEEKDPMQVIEDITAEREQFYKALKTFDTFGKGWLRRNDETCEYSLLLAGGMT
jgi:lysozyme family protein